MNFSRDQDGKYILEDYGAHGYEKLHLTQVSGAKDGASSSFWLEGKDKKYLVKSSLKPEYIVSVYGELLFSELAKMNGLPCANVDAGNLGGIDMVISEDVCEEGSERLTYDMLCEIGEYSDYSIEGICEKVNIFAKKNNIECQKDLRLQLYKYALMDYLCCQSDRHEENLLFEIVDQSGKKTIRLCPLYDNELAFMFGYVQDHIDDIPLPQVVQISVKVNHVFHPVLGTDFDVQSFRHAVAGDVVKMLKNKQLDKLVLKRFANSFAIEIMNNPELKKFYDNLDFSIFKAAKEIEKETNFKIPYDYLRLAEDVVYERQQLLDQEIKDYKEMVLGE